MREWIQPPRGPRPRSASARWNWTPRAHAAVTAARSDEGEGDRRTPSDVVTIGSRGYCTVVRAQSQPSSPAAFTAFTAMCVPAGAFAITALGAATDIRVRIGSFAGP